MDDNNKNADSKNSYDALRSMFLHPPVYLPPPLGQSLESMMPGVIPGQGAASNLMFGHPFAPGLPMMPYRDFAYLPFPAAAAALEGNRSGQSPTDGAAAASAANFWTGLYPFVADPFLAEAMKMNLSPYLAHAEGSKDRKSGTGKEGKKNSSPKTDLRDLKRKPERSSSTHSEGSTSSHDRQTPGNKSPATQTSSSPHRKEHLERNSSHSGPPPLIKTPPLAHERKRPKLEQTVDEALDFSSKPRLLDSKRSLIPARDSERERQRDEKKTRGVPNFGDVEWLSNPDSSPKTKGGRDKTTDLFLSDPRSVLRGEALQVRIAQYNVSQLRSKLDMENDNNWTARIEPDFTDLGQYKDKSSKLERSETFSAFERVEQKLGRDSVIVSRSEPKSFSERMSDIARRHAAANDLKEPGLDLRGLGKPNLDLRALSAFGRHNDLSLDLKIPTPSSRSEPSNHKASPEETRKHDEPQTDKGESLTLKDSVDNILDSILNTYDEADEKVDDSAIHSKTPCDEQTEPAADDQKPELEKVEMPEPVPSKSADVPSMSGGEMHGLASSFLPLSEVLSTAINSEFARSQQPSIPTTATIPNHLFSQPPNAYCGQSREDSPHISIENIIDRLEKEDTDEQDEEPKTSAVTNCTRDDDVRCESGYSRLECNSAPSQANNTPLPESKPCHNVNTGDDESKHADITTGQTDPKNLRNGDQKPDAENKTKLVLVKDPRVNGYAVKGSKGQEALITPAVVEKVVNSVMLHDPDTENGVFKVPADMASNLTS